MPGPRIYTRTGDGGETSLFSGGRVRKDALRIECTGCVDELTAHLGVVRAALRGGPGGAAGLADVVLRIQNELLDLGAVLGCAQPAPGTRGTFSDALAMLEQDIDAWTATLPELRTFIVAGGGPVSAQIHVARTVCRRAERMVCRLAAVETMRGDVLAYLNRLSDALFVMARQAAHLLGEEEERWTPTA